MKLFTVLTMLALAASNRKCNAFSAVTTRSEKGRNIIAMDAAGGSNIDTVESIKKVASASAAAMFLSGSLLMAGAPVAQAVTASFLLADSTPSLDFSLPSYDMNMAGFGEGKEAYVKKGGNISPGSTSDALLTDPGADEKEKQLASMRKAEEARKVALAQKKAAQKERDEEAKRRAKEKKERDAERLKNIWSS